MILIFSVLCILPWQGTRGRGVRHVVYWRHDTDIGVHSLKVNLILYENDVLQVTGSSFYLWVLESYPGLVRLVEFLMQEAQNRMGGGCYDPDCVCGGRGERDEEDRDLSLLNTSSSVSDSFFLSLMSVVQMWDSAVQVNPGLPPGAGGGDGRSQGEDL